VTMATSLESPLSNTPERHDLAMTGEVTLRGRVLPIGGVKEKVLGAVRAGITTIVLPKDNGPDLDDLPPDVRQAITVHLIEELGEVLSLALRGAKFEAGQLVFDGPAPVEPRMVTRN
ncbi:MAG: S16 family serine protease, partial [Gemmatimonadales bacterium]